MIVRGKTFLWLLLASLVLLSVSDFLITKEYLAQVGNVGEFNPLLRVAIGYFGVNFIVYFKILTLVVMAGCVYIVSPITRAFNWIRVALIALNVGGVALVG